MDTYNEIYDRMKTAYENESGCQFDEASDIAIPQGTVVATADIEPLRFCTMESGEIKAGNTLVSLYAEAETAGKSSNIEAGTAVVAVSVPPEVETVTNRVPFCDGTNEETDDELRTRIKKNYQSTPNGTNKAFYEQLALSVDGITRVDVAPKVRGVGTVDVYVYGNTSAPDEDIIAQAQSLISKSRELNVDIQVLPAQESIVDLGVTINAKNGYSRNDVYNMCKQAFTDCLNSIAIGGTLYLSYLGSYLMATGCIENYSFDASMSNKTLAVSQCFAPGEIVIEVV